MDYSKSVRSRVIKMEKGETLFFCNDEVRGSTLRNYAASIGPLTGRSYEVHKVNGGFNITRW